MVHELVPEYSLEDVLRERNISPSEAEGFGNIHFFRAAIDKGWLSMESSLFKKILGVFKDFGKPFPTAEYLIHIEIVQSIRILNLKGTKEDAAERLKEYSDLRNRSGIDLVKNSEYQENVQLVTKTLKLDF